MGDAEAVADRDHLNRGVLQGPGFGLVAMRGTHVVRIAPAAEPTREMIEAALKSARGVISQAATELGLSRQALYRRMDKLGISGAGG